MIVEITKIYTAESLKYSTFILVSHYFRKNQWWLYIWVGRGTCSNISLFMDFEWPTELSGLRPKLLGPGEFLMGIHSFGSSILKLKTFFLHVKLII